MTAVPDPRIARIARLAEVLLHAERGVRPLSTGSGRVRNRPRVVRSRPVPRVGGHAGVAEQVAGIIESLHPDDLAELSQALKDRYRLKAQRHLKDINDAGFAVRSFMKRGSERDSARKRIAHKYLQRRKGILRSLPTTTRN